jgi:hypothetical protein
MWVFMILGSVILFGLLNNRPFRSAASEALTEKDETPTRLYLEKESSIDSVYQFLKNRQGKLKEIRLDAEGITLKLLSENYEEMRGGQPAMLHHRSNSEFHSEEEPEIINGALRTDSYGRHRLYTDYWSYDLRVARIRDINTTIIDYLVTSHEEVQGILTIMARAGFKVKAANGAVSITFDYKNRVYAFISDKSLMGYKDKIQLKLDSGKYLLKKSRFSQLKDQ